jgi:hypothetical protein
MRCQRFSALTINWKIKYNADRGTWVSKPRLAICLRRAGVATVDRAGRGGLARTEETHPAGGGMGHPTLCVRVEFRFDMAWVEIAASLGARGG